MGKLFLSCFLGLFVPALGIAQQTSVIGKITDAESGQSVTMASITFSGTKFSVGTDTAGRFNLTANGRYSRIIISRVGYQPVIRAITAGTPNEILVKLTRSNNQLKEVSVSAGKSKPYRNKDNPAVELIQRVIAKKDSNRAEASAYLQYDQYERVGLTLFNIPSLLLNNFLLKPYRFMVDTARGKLSAPVYLSEKTFKVYDRGQPKKSIRIQEGQKEGNIVKFIDTAGLNIYINRLYGDKIDIYQNNIFVINFQLLSPIADHSPDFYKFFITDTVRTATDTLVELSFIPRNKGDLLFEGHLLVTLDGRYAVTACELDVNRQININFLRSLNIGLDFQKQPNGRYFLTNSHVKADFGILKNKGFGVVGERSIYYSNYLVNSPLDAQFYNGRSEQTAPDFDHPDSTYWAKRRPDTLPAKETAFYDRVSKLEQMKSFKVATWIASTLNGGFADTGPFQFNTGDLLSYSTIEGLRLGIGGRTTPKFNKTVYFDGYVADGLGDHKWKYNASVYYSFNETPFYRYPNNYLKATRQYDIGLPGQDNSNGNFRTPLSNFQTGTSRYYFYSNTYKLDYVKEFYNHFSFDVGFFNQSQQATGALMYTRNDAQHTIIDQITTSAVTLSLRYAPHEQLFQGTNDRNVIKYKYPIFTLLFTQGLKGVWNGSINYNSVTATVVKRFYLSQLGFADVTLLGGVINGKVPFPLLNISQANQSIVYDNNAYNLMHTLEFVNDHYAGVNVTQSFNGFFLNKIPLIEHLKWREFLTFKALYGGLRAENNPQLTDGLYNFPVPVGSTTGTYTLSHTPYIEAGAGIGNIFKVFRVEGIKRFNYLDHPGVSKYGVKLTLNVDL